MLVNQEDSLDGTSHFLRFEKLVFPAHVEPKSKLKLKKKKEKDESAAMLFPLLELELVLVAKLELREREGERTILRDERLRKDLVRIDLI